MTGLVEDLLQASHVMQGRIELDRQPVDLRKVVAEAVDSIAQAAQERRQALTVRTAEKPIPVSVDVLRIRQILANLLDNAVKYTPAEGSIEVRVEAADRAARVHGWRCRSGSPRCTTAPSPCRATDAAADRPSH